MESTTNVNEPVTTENQGNSDVKAPQPTFEELAEQDGKAGTEPDQVTEQLETQGNPEMPGEVDVQMQLIDTEHPDLEKLESNNEPIVPELTPEEKIIDTWLQNGKTEVSMNELIEAGFDAEELDPQSNTIGCFKLSRILLVSPFRIEKINKDTEKI